MRKLYIYPLILFLTLFLFNCTSKEGFKFSFPNNQSSESRFTNLWETFYSHLDNKDPDSALFYAYKIRELSKDNNNKTWLAKSNKAIGYILSEKGRIRESTTYYLTAAKLFSETGHLKELADIYLNLGADFYDLQKYDYALSFYEKAKEIYHYEGSASEKELAFRGIALCYKRLKNYEKAEEFLKLSIHTLQERGNSYSLAIILNTWGTLKLEQKKHKEAYNLFLKTLQIAESLQETNNLKALASNNLGETLLETGKYPEAKKWLELAITEKRLINDPVSTLTSCLHLAKILTLENEHEKAISLLEGSLHGISPGTTHPSINESLTLINEALVKANEQATPAQLPDFNRKLLTYSQKLLAYNKNVSETKERLETISQQQDIQEAMETHALNEQIAAYEQRNTYMEYAILIPVFFLICAIFSVYFSMQRNLEYKKLYKKIEETINSSKQLRQLKKK